MKNDELWKTIERPGNLGKERDTRYAMWDERYGKGNWRIMWVWNGRIITREFAYQLYEDGYYTDSFKREELWKELVSVAGEVYDIEPEDVQSGLDYLVQKAATTHLQDITIRRVVWRRGWHFQGDELVQIRGRKSYWGLKLGPAKVPFHLPHLITEPHLKGWWDYNSIEDFYQSNRVLQVKEHI